MGSSLLIYDTIYLLTAIGLSPGGSTHLHTNNTQNNTNNNRKTQIQTNVEECGPCPVFVSFTLAFALQLRKKHGKTSVRVRKTSVRLRKTSVKVQYAYYQKHPHAHTHTTKQYKTTTVQIKTKCVQEKQQYLVSNVVNPQVQHTIFTCFDIKRPTCIINIFKPLPITQIFIKILSQECIFFVYI